MIDKETLDEALLEVRDIQYNADLPWSKFMESMNFDPNGVLEIAAEHSEIMRSYGLDDPALSFGSGFTLALVALSMQKRKGE